MFSSLDAIMFYIRFYILYNNNILTIIIGNKHSLTD